MELTSDREEREKHSTNTHTLEWEMTATGKNKATLREESACSRSSGKISSRSPVERERSPQFKSIPGRVQSNGDSLAQSVWLLGYLCPVAAGGKTSQAHETGSPQLAPELGHSAPALATSLAADQHDKWVLACRTRALPTVP